MLPLAALADGASSIDTRFDLTGDNIVDASDWKKMSEEAKQAYATESVRALGEDPDAVVKEGVTRSALFLKGLNAVYNEK